MDSVARCKIQRSKTVGWGEFTNPNTKTNNNTQTKTMHYRRTKTKGGCYFFTVNLANRRSKTLTENIATLKQSISNVKNNHPFEIDAMVVLPDHLHTIWTLPHGDVDYPKRWMLIKANFSRQLPKLEFRIKSRIQKGERGIWQRRYWEHLIRDEKDYQAHLKYIHFNPVKHGYVQNAIDWPHSSIHRFIKEGKIESEWQAKYKEYQHHYGEPA